MSQVVVHVVPKNDLKEHNSDFGGEADPFLMASGCSCHPEVRMEYHEVDDYYSYVIIHRAWDGRE